MVCILWHIVVKYKLKLYRNFEHKGDKATMQILNLKTKTITSKHSIHIISLPQTISADFVLLLYYAYIYQYFLIPVQSFSACTFSRIVVCFQCKLSTVWSCFPVRWPRQEAKTKQHSQQQEAKGACTPTNCRQSMQRDFFGALSQGLCADWLVCIAYRIFWHLISSDQLFYFS